jgi:hypothetical protein
MLDGVGGYLDPRQGAPDPQVDRRSHPTRVVQGPRLDPHTIRKRSRNVVDPRAARWTEVAGHGPTAFSRSAVCLEVSPRDLQLVCGDDNGHAKRAARLTSALRAMARIGHVRLACNFVTHSTTKTPSGTQHL